jgi:hypothetical protein
MGQKASQYQLPGLMCCTERQDASKNAIGGNNPTVSRSHVTGGYHGGPVPDIAARFDAAVKSKDLVELVKLLSSTHKLGKDVAATQHPWAEQPQTIGALAAVHIAVLANDPSLRNRLRAAGAIPILVQFLNASNTRDKIHSSVVALSFLTVENEENCREVYRCGALPLLVPMITSQPEGLAFASSSVCRNLYFKNRNAREEFVNLNGIRSMMELLHFQPSRATDTAYMDGIYETISNLSDLITPDATTNDSGGRIVKRAAKENIVDTIQIIVDQCKDDEIKTEGTRLNGTINKYLKAAFVAGGSTTRFSS